MRYTLGKGRHEYGFGVDFSLLSLYAHAELSHNPYFRACHHSDSSRIYYTICVAVKGCGPFRRRVRKSMYLVAATLDQPGIPRLPPSKGLSRQSFQVVNLDAFGLRSEPNREDDKVPPPYTPALVLRAGISSDGGLLYAGDSLPLKLWVTIPLAAQAQLKTVLKSARLFLVDPTVVSDHGRRVVRPAGTFIQEVQLDITLQTRSKNETFEVDPASWKGCKVPRSLSFTKSTHEAVQPYLLQILCEFSCEGVARSTVRNPRSSAVDIWFKLNLTYSSRVCYYQWTLPLQARHPNTRPLTASACIALLKKVCLNMPCKGTLMQAHLVESSWKLVQS